MNTFCSDKGFTLIELLITLSVFSILAAMSIPSLKNIVQNNSMVASYNELLGALNFTRSIAVTEGQGATICKRNAAGNNCDDNAEWGAGWIVFVDNDNDGVIDSNETVLRLFDALKDNLNLTYPKNRFRFNRQGFSTGYAGKFNFCDSRGDSSKRGMVVSNTGRIRTAARDELPNCSGS